MHAALAKLSVVSVCRLACDNLPVKIFFPFFTVSEPQTRMEISSYLSLIMNTESFFLFQYSCPVMAGASGLISFAC